MFDVVARLTETNQALTVLRANGYAVPPEAVEIQWQLQRIIDLENAIKTHRSQKADDRCIEDDDRLYEALGDGIKCDRRVGDKAAMLRNCERFIDNRCQGGGWPNYAQLEAEIGQAHHALDLMEIPRDTADSDGDGRSKLTLLGRLRLVQAEVAR